MKTAMAIRNNVSMALDFFEPVDGFVNHPANDKQGYE
jgi:hypothetical protein